MIKNDNKKKNYIVLKTQTSLYIFYFVNKIALQSAYNEIISIYRTPAFSGGSE